MLVTMIHFLLLLLFYPKVVFSSNAVCEFPDQVTFSCEDIVLEDLYKEFFSEKVKFELPEISTLTIANSNVPKIEYFYKPNRLNRLNNLEIKNSSVEIIYNMAFDDFEYLKTLDLGFNALEDISFVESLPKSIITLFLNNNKISFISVDFTGLFSLKKLDLSYNNIKFVEFEKLRNLGVINLSHNEIISISFERTHDYFHGYDLNLSFNKIVNYVETDIFSITKLDLSYNNLSTVNITGKNYLNLSHCKVVDFVIDTYVHEADLSSFNSVKKIDLPVLRYLNLKDNNFSDLSNSIINFKTFTDLEYSLKLDMSNSSITRIPVHHFDDMDIDWLNLSFNNIQVISKHTFTNCKLSYLDLSNSKIQSLQPSSFQENVIDTLYLNKNEISSLENFVDNTRIFTIDLSFNPIKFIKKNYFVNCRDLRKIILSNCLIQNIEPGTFSTKLFYLDLDYNNFTVLNEGMFVESLEELKLNGNPVGTIKRGSLSNLYGLSKLDLSNLRIENIEPHSFTNLTDIEEINLANNRIKLIESNLFVNVKKLTKIDFSNNPINKINKFSNKLNISDLTLTFNGDFQPNSIGNLKLLKLTIKNSTISTLKSGSFKGLYSLTELHFHNSSIGSLEPGALQDLISLVHLDEQNLFKNINEINRNVLNDLKSLKTLNLSSMDLKNLDSYCFDGLNKVQTLDLSNNNISQLKSNTFYGLKSLATLDLSNNNISELKSNTFYGLESLETLDLSNNNIEILEHNVFTGPNNLFVLNLAYNNLERVDVSLFEPLKYLRTLNVSNNNFGLSATPHNTFQIGTLSSLIELKVLDLSNNYLNNLDVKTQFISLKKLTHLFLDHNYLKSLDFNSLIKNCKHFSYVGISYNMWKCDYLADVVETLYNNSISYYPVVPVFNADNVEGINCTDICKYLYCQDAELSIN